MRKSHNGLGIRSKIWLEAAGEPIFGRRRRFLLEAIDQHGSINRAAHTNLDKVVTNRILPQSHREHGGNRLLLKMFFSVPDNRAGLL